MRFVYRLAVPLLLLSACAPAAPEPVAEWHTIESPALGIRFMHPEAIVSVDADAGEGADEWATAVGPAYGFIVPEGGAPDGPGDWTVPEGFFALVAEEPSCELLQEPGVYLPVNFAEVYACDVLEREDGTFAFYAVGIGRPQESFVFLESIILIPGEEASLVLQGIAPLQAYPPAAEELFALSPDTAYGTAEFMRLQEELLQILRREIDPTSPATDAAMTALWRIAESVTGSSTN